MVNFGNPILSDYFRLKWQERLKRPSLGVHQNAFEVFEYKSGFKMRLSNGSDSLEKGKVMNGNPDLGSQNETHNLRCKSYTQD